MLVIISSHKQAARIAEDALDTFLTLHLSRAFLHLAGQVWRSMTQTSRLSFAINATQKIHIHWLSTKQSLALEELSGYL